MALTWLVVMVIGGIAWLACDLSQRPWVLSPPRLPADASGAKGRSLADVRHGDHVAIVGIVGGNEELRAPLSGRPCVLYRVEVFDHDTRKLVGQITRGHGFVVADQNGRAYVEPAGAMLRLTRARLKQHYEADFLVGMLSLGHMPRGRLLVAFEGRLSRGETVTVIGSVATREDVAESVYRSVAAPASVAITGADGASLVISDLDDDRFRFG